MTDRRSEDNRGEAASPHNPAFLVDKNGRRITYLRLSVTDRCDLRCRYCCPEAGIPLVPHDQILTFEELVRLVEVFARLGVNKVRLTGGEPFARQGLITFIKMVRAISGIDSLYLTTNGVQAAGYLDDLKEAGISGLNLSLDTLDSSRYKEITRRDRLSEVMRTFHGAIERNIPIKVNSVVMEDTKDSEIADLVGLGKKDSVTVRFIEKMPFSGADHIAKMDNGNLLDRLRKIFPEMVEEHADIPSTARVFTLPGYQGKLGVIEGNSRHFCRSCNKVRITPTGILKTCLYDDGTLDLREVLRAGCKDEEIAELLKRSVRSRASDGHAAEKKSGRFSEPSMAGIGG
ncbi:MAG: GTP 3',8-cyclase MoaA [Desulfocapsaceae bacterium]|nr:GTP 3',8-cyclase MoaA [Desulfocapsaceae bacterium]